MLSKRGEGYSLLTDHQSVSPMEPSSSLGSLSSYLRSVPCSPALLAPGQRIELCTRGFGVRNRPSPPGTSKLKVFSGGLSSSNAESGG